MEDFLNSRDRNLDS